MKIIRKLLLFFYNKKDLYYWNYNLPELDGEYVVKTKTNILKNEYIMSANIKTNEKGQRIWSFKNQEFVCYLTKI